MLFSSIPLVDLKRQYNFIKDEINSAIIDVLNSGVFIMGENVKVFETEFAEYLGVKHGVGVASGTDSLIMALRALGVRGGEVITVSFTFISSVDCIVHNDATPVFVDIDPETYTMDVSQVDKMITEKTKAVIPVHLYGHPVDMDPLVEIAEKHGLFVIEDAAQAHGAEYKRRKAGSFGHVACFSFYPSKNLGAYGDGGMVVTNDPQIAEKVRMLREYGQRSKYVHEVIGYNSRLDEMQAAMLRVKLRHLNEWNEMRRKKAKLYNELLSTLDKENKVKTPMEKAYAKHVYHLYMIQVQDRNNLRNRLAKRGISTGMHYPVPVHLQEAYRNIVEYKGRLCVTEDVSKKVVSLPMFPELTEDEINYITDSLKKSLACVEQ